MQTRIQAIINTRLSCSAVWVICGAGLALVVVPRLASLSANFLYYDDFFQLPVTHLETHRFVQAAEQAFWLWVYGPYYERSFIPKLVSLVYIVVGIWAVAKIFRAWKVPLLTASIAVFIFLSHPIMTDYVVWNSLSPANLAWVFMLLGYWAQLKTGQFSLTVAVALAFFGLGTYQIVIGLPVMLVLAEWTLRLACDDKENMPWKRRLVWIALPLVLYAIYLFVSDWIFGFTVSARPSGWRGLVNPSEILSLSFIFQKYRVSSAGYFNVFQPVLSYYFGDEAAWRGGWRAWMFIALSVPISLLLTRRPVRVLVSCSALFLGALVVPMAFHWFVSQSSLGWRVAIGMLFAFCLWFVVLSMILLKREDLRGIVAFINLIAIMFLILLIPVTAKDAENRAQGSEATKNLIEFLGSTPSPAEAAAFLIDVKRVSSGQRSSSGAIVMSYREISCKSYSLAGYQDALEPVLASGHVKLVAEAHLATDVRTRLKALCEQSLSQQRCGIFGVRDSVSKLGGVCLLRPYINAFRPEQESDAPK
jgi:hypothetical protein